MTRSFHLIGFILCCIGFFFLTGLTAQDEYRAVQWSVNDGLSWAGKNYMLKDAKGFLWVSSFSGINRFDGKTFKHFFKDKNKPGALLGGVTAYPLVEDSLNNIWIGSNDGLSRYDIRADSFSNFKLYPDSSQESRHCYPVWATKSEVFAVHMYLKTIFRFNIHTLEKEVLIKLGPEDTVDTNNFSDRSIFFNEKTNSLWIPEGIVAKPGGGLLEISLSSGKRTHYPLPCFKNIAGHPHLVQGINFDQERDCFWLNTKDGLFRFTLTDKQFHHIDVFNEWVNLKDYNFLDAGGVTIDQQKRVWVATFPNGIIIYDPVTGSVSYPFQDEKRLKEISIANLSIYADSDGMIWLSFWGDKGIYQLIPYSPVVRHYDSKNFQSPIQNMFLADKGKILVGGWSGLYSFDPASEAVIMLKKGAVHGIGSNSNFPMMVDTIRQKAWVGIEPWGIEEMDLSSLTYKPLIFKDLQQRNIVPGIINSWSQPFRNGFLFVVQGSGIFTVSGDSLVAQQLLNIPQTIYSPITADDKYLFLYCAEPLNNLTYVYQNAKWIKTANPLDSLAWSNIFYNQVDHSYWVGTDKELFHFDSAFRKIRSYSDRDGLPEQSWVVITADETGNIWLSNPPGVISQLNTKTGQISKLSEKDGYQKNSFGAWSPFVKDANGNLYYAGLTGIDRVSPDKFTSAPPSSVYIESLEVNQKAASLSTGVNNLVELTLKYFQKNISISTGIIDYYSKGTGRIRYKLEGLNENWQYVPNYTTIRYEGLQPAKYRLVMQASNATNEFNGPLKTLIIHISPPFWETWWFRSLAVMAILLMFYGIYRWRTATLRKQKKILELTVIERTAEVVAEKAEIEKKNVVIQNEKEKSETLLLNILPFEVANELKEKGYTTAKSFEEVTVLFSDIKGFTSVAEKMTAQELVKEINTYFSAFDQVTIQFGLEKIKTIGDAYISAGGLPEKNLATAVHVVEAALAMQQVVENLKQERIKSGRPYFELRIGIHTGPVVAGVVGIKKFQYDIWGDTVNLAARMEQSGIPGKINISQHTYELVKNKFNCVYRGKIEAKNKGGVDMYFVESLNSNTVLHNDSAKQ